MNKEPTGGLNHEDAFVRSFILPEKKARYGELLSKPKRRKEILDRLNHTLDFDTRFAQKLGGDEMFASSLEKILRQKGAENICHIISTDRTLDGKELPLNEAVELVLDYQFGSVICCSPGKLAFYRPEAPSNGYILKRKQIL